MTTITPTSVIADRAAAALAACGHPGHGPESPARTPVTGGTFIYSGSDATTAEQAAERAAEVFRTWRRTPAPVRGNTVRVLGDLLRTHKGELATLIQCEAGKIRSEALGEVQEMIDICEYAVGLSRQLHGLTIASERPGHRLMETWQPLGPVAVITAFNFPAAVWAWNAALAVVCGDPVIWKASDLTPMTTHATHALAREAARLTGAPDDLFQVVFGGPETGQALAAQPAIPLVSATGSTRMGRVVAETTARRFGRSLLELGGNNATIVTPSADLDMAVRAVTFAAAGTAGQRCTTLRRLIAHRSVVDQMVTRLADVYSRLPIGDPFHEQTLVGPLINTAAHRSMEQAIEQARRDGGTVTTGGQRLHGDLCPESAYVAPAIVVMPGQTAAMREETFAPLLYVLAYDELEEAIALNNDVPQGLSSSIFTRDLREAERFTGPEGSDCGLANVNMGPSGAEIGGAFGGEKETGGGRESGSDAWRAYMRRTTNTINYSDELPLAQGVVFGD